MLANVGAATETGLNQLKQVYCKSWKKRYSATNAARTVTIKDLTWENFYRQNHGKRSRGGEQALNNDPRLRLVRDVQHQLQAIGLLQKKGRFSILRPLPDTPPLK